MILLYITSVLVSFTACFLKGFQHKNVIGNHIKSVFFTSWLMAAFDVAAVTIIVKGGWTVAISAGLEASVGMVAAIKFHNRIFEYGKESRDPTTATHTESPQG